MLVGLPSHTRSRQAASVLRDVFMNRGRECLLLPALANNAVLASDAVNIAMVGKAAAVA